MTTTTTETLPDGATGGQAQPIPGAVTTAATSGEGNIVVDSLPGEAGESAPDDAQGHTEEGPDGSESTEEFAEASGEALAVPAAADSALGDLRRIEGFDEATAAESAGPARQGLLPDASAALGVGQEFAFLAPLAATVGPWLATTVGPAIASRVFDKLSDRAKRIVSRPPTGSGTVSVLIRLLNEARKRATESGAEAVAESTVDEVAQAMEVIIGTDDRIRVTATEPAPWRWICALRIEFPTGAVYRGTGFLIGPQAVATAGHCMNLPGHGWARRVEVIPGSDGTERPYGSTLATGYRSTVGWVKDRLPTHDYGALFLPADAFGGRQLGSFGFADFPTEVLLAQPAVLAGYPGDKPFAELWGLARRIKAVTPTQLQYDTDTMGGQSGAGLYITRNGHRYVVGIHNYGASTGNTATRVTKPVAENLQRWSQHGAPVPPATQ